MGNCFGDPKVAANRKQNLKKYKQTLQVLGLTQSDADTLFQFFSKMDEDGSNCISISEFFMYLDLDKTKFAKRAFSLFDEDGSGEIDFREFLVGLWNYCTYTKHALIMFAFDLYDTDASGLIDIEEMQRIVKEVYGEGFRTNIYAQRIMEQIVKLGGSLERGETEITRDQFAKFTINHPALLFPAFQLQLALQQKIMGERFWEAAAKQREARFGHVKDLKEFLTQINELAFKELATFGQEEPPVQVALQSSSQPPRPASFHGNSRSVGPAPAASPKPQRSNTSKKLAAK